MRSEIVNVIGSVVMIAMAMPIMASASDSAADRDNRSYAESAILSLAASLNFNDVVNIMTPATRNAWMDFAQKTTIDGKQYFIPDFFKVKHLLVSERDEKGYVLGLYNPFYDSAVLLLVEDAGAAARISGMRIVTGSWLRDEGKCPEFPKTSGLNPPDEYISLLLVVMNSTASSFHVKMGKGYREAFNAIRPYSADEVDYIMRTLKFRIAQVVKMSEEPRLKVQVAFAGAVLRDSALADGKRVSRDHATQRVVNLLSGKLERFRKSFQVVSYFPDGQNCNAIFANNDIRSLLVHAHVSADGNVWFKLLDTSLVGNKQFPVK